jgi:hypothetical protein
VAQVFILTSTGAIALIYTDHHRSCSFTVNKSLSPASGTFSRVSVVTQFCQQLHFFSPSNVPILASACLIKILPKTLYHVTKRMTFSGRYLE